MSELIPHERVIAELEKDTQSTDTGLGLPPGCFQCGHFPQLLVVEVKVEEEKYERGVQWLRDVLYGTQFTAERLKIIANRKIGDISSLKRSGSKIVRTLLQDLVFSRGLLSVCLSVHPSVCQHVCIIFSVSFPPPHPPPPLFLMHFFSVAFYVPFHVLFYVPFHVF